MATRDELREWSAAARRYGFRAVRGHLERLDTPRCTAIDLAEEAVQEALPRVIERTDPARIQSQTHFCRTVARAAINQAIVNHRRQLTHGGRSGVLDYDPADPCSVDVSCWTDDCSEAFRAAFAALAAHERLLLRLKDVEEWTLQQLADVFGGTFHQMWVRLQRLRNGLRDVILNDADDAGDVNGA